MLSPDANRSPSSAPGGVGPVRRGDNHHHVQNPRGVKVDEAVDRVIQDTCAIALIPAPTHGEEERIAWAEDRLRFSRGSRVRDKVGNLLWTWGEGRPRLMLTAHVDTVFPLRLRTQSAGPTANLWARASVTMPSRWRS